MDDKNENEQLEVLEENPFKGKTTDIEQTVFQSIPRSNISNVDYGRMNSPREEIPVVKPVVKREPLRPSKKQNKKVKVSLGFMFFVVLAINLAWFLSLIYAVLPNYNTYKQESEAIKDQIRDLESKVKAITGE